MLSKFPVQYSSFPIKRSISQPVSNQQHQQGYSYNDTVLLQVHCYSCQEHVTAYYNMISYKMQFLV